MPGQRQNGRDCSGSSHVFKAALLGAIALAVPATRASTAGAHVAAASRAASRRAPAASSSPANNRWVSKALASRGGADEPAEETAEGIPGVLSEVEVALSSFNDIVGENLLVVDNPKKGTTKEVSASETLDGKHVAFYFSSQAVEDQLEKAAQGQETVRPTPVVKEAYKKAKDAGKELEVVYVPVADSLETYEKAIKDMPWKGIVHNNATVANLIRKAEIRVLPAVIVVDDKGEVVTRDGYSNMVFFPEDFPWKNKSLKEMLGPKFLKADGSEVTAEALEGKVLAVYFSASWCAPCKQFTPILKSVYSKLQKDGKPFEIVFVSSDKSEEEFSTYMGDMPWLSVPFDGKTRGTIAQLLGVSALPTLLVFDEEQQLITANGRQEIIKDTKAENFPWYPKALAELVESPEVITQKPSFIVFMEGGDKDEQARIRELVEPMAEARAKMVEDGKARPAGFLTASEIEPLSTAFRKLVGLDEIQGKYKFMKSKKALLKPRVALLDLMRNQFAVSEEGDLTEESLAAFVASWDAGELETKEFNLPAKGEEGDAEGAAE
ncbi:unnamed protein product [Ectocarpus sp. 6 AP-2014]